jgi:hypothetical protein
MEEWRVTRSEPWHDPLETLSGGDGEVGMAKILESGSQKAGFFHRSSVWTYAIRIFGTRIMHSLNSPSSRVSALQSNQCGGTLIFTGAKKKRWTAGNS